MRASMHSAWVVTVGCALSALWACSPNDQSAYEPMSNDASEMRADAGAVEPSVIDIIIDEQGIPHIFADTDEDLFYGYGYQIATDRLFQLDMFRRRALGRTSEVLGVEGIIPDQQAAIFNWAHWGRLDGQWMATHEPIRYRLIESYVEGVNARISEVLGGDVALPHEYGAEGYDFRPEHWSADDVFVIQKMAGFSQDLTLEFEVLLTLADRFFGHLLEGIELFKPVRTAFGMPDSDRQLQLGQTHPDPIQMTTPGTIPFSPHITPSTGLRGLTKIRGLGSNNLAVDGRHTDTGAPYLAGDPHMGIGYSGLLYAVHLNSKDSGGLYNVAGFAFVGAPGIAMGHNEHVSWSPTSSFADVMDLWEVEVSAEGVHVGDDCGPCQREVTFAFEKPGARWGKAKCAA